MVEMEEIIQKYIQNLKNCHGEIFNEILNGKWTICIPDSVTSSSTVEEVLNYIIIEDDNGSWHSFDGQKCALHGKQLLLHEKSYTIRGSEQYYSEDGRSCSLIFVTTLSGVDGNHSEHDLDLSFTVGIHDRISKSKKQMRKIECLKRKMKIPSAFKTLDHVSTEFYKVVDIITKVEKNFIRNKKLVPSTNASVNAVSVDSTVENFVFKSLQPQIMDVISSLGFNEDAQLNKIRQSISHLSTEQMHVRSDMEQEILPARRWLNMIPNFESPNEKYTALRRALKTFTDMRHNNTPVLTDDVLAAFVFAVQSSMISNWFAQYKCMQNFTKHTGFDPSNQYYLSTLEAALEYIKGISFEVQLTVPTQLQSFQDCANMPQDCDKCHPLCACITDKDSYTTVRMLSKRLLRYAFLGCISDIESLLFENRLDLTVSDYAGRSSLHLASKMGHQSVVLVLCYSGANINAKDSENCTPLHYAAGSGHISCVKALLYYAESTNTKLNVNTLTYQGETPLILAAKWGFLPVIQCLLEHGSDPSVKSRSGKTAYDLAAFPEVRNAIKCAMQRKEEINSFEMVCLEHSSTKGSANIVPGPMKETVAQPEDEKGMGTVEDFQSKVRNAVANGDVPLLIYYLKFEYKEIVELVSTDDSVPAELKCHPLCQCENCCDVVKVTKYKLTRKPEVVLNAALLDQWIELARQCRQTKLEKLLFLLR